MGEVEVLIVGVGGQGIVLAGRILGLAASLEGKYVAQTQSYGARVRGTPVWSGVIISDKRINYPFVRRCDILVALNPDALRENLPLLREGGVLLVDTSLVEAPSGVRADVHGVEATRVAERRIGSKLYANMVMLGALTAITNLVKVDAMERAIRETLTEDEERNVRAFRAGLELAR